MRNDQEPPTLNGRRGLARLLPQVSPWRAFAAVVLLAGLFALLTVLLLSRGESARLVETPADGDAPGVGVRAGDLARDFDALGLDGERLRLSDLRGAPVVVNFWATWCVSCLAEMPVLEEQRLANQQDGLQILAVNVGEGRGDAQSFIDDLSLGEFFVALDPDLTVTDAYGVRGLPHSVFIDSAGVIQAEYRGQLDEETMQSYVRAAIAGVRGEEPEARLRIVTTVPRTHLLEVSVDDDAPGRVIFASRRFRCGDDYCGDVLRDQALEINGVVSADVDSDAVMPSLAVSFDGGVIDIGTLVDAVAALLRAQPDPLYTRELEVSFPQR